jgi:hypothetical protein
MDVAGISPRDQPRAWGEMMGASATAASPIQATGAADLMSTATPYGLNTGVQLATGQDYFRGRQIATDRGDREAGVVAHAASDASQALIGKGRPSEWEFGMRDMSGNLGAAALAGIDLVASMLGAVPSGTEPKSLESTPVTGSVSRRFVGDATGGRLDRAARAMISPEVGRVISDVGLREDQVIGVNATGPSDFRFTRAEQAAAQRTMNERLSDPQAGITNLPRQIQNWNELPRVAKQNIVRERLNTARQFAENSVLRTMDEGERTRRYQKARTEKAG